MMSISWLDSKLALAHSITTPMIDKLMSQRYSYTTSWA